MRRKRWARPELAACPYCVDDPPAQAGGYALLFAKDQPMMLELGCGKGVATAAMAFEHPETNYVAVDVGRDVLAVARRNIALAYGEKPIDNILLVPCDIQYIRQVFVPPDCFERIYIRFPNPWTLKKRHEKRRLTHPRQLLQYRAFLRPGGEIWFKTDDDALFAASLGYFADCGFAVVYQTDDLAASGFQPNYESEHERMFKAEGKKIHMAIARMTALDLKTKEPIDDDTL